MSWSLVIAVLGVALVDAVNPSALAMTGYLLSLERPMARIRAYIAAIFVAYLMIGIVVVFGVGDGVTAVIEALGRPAVGYAVQGALGLAAIGFAARRPRPPKDGGARAAAVRTAGQAFVLGVTVTAVEATTALPYLGALTLIVRADGPPLAQLSLLVAYNVLFVTPPILLAALGSRQRGALRRWLDRPRRPTSDRARAVMRVLCGIVGVVLLVDAIVWGASGEAVF